MNNRRRIHEAVLEIKRLTPKAVERIPWSVCLDALQYAASIEQDTLKLGLSEEELRPYLDLILEKRNMIRRAARPPKVRKPKKKRRR